MNDASTFRHRAPLEANPPGTIGAIYDATIFGGAVRVIGFGRFYENRRGVLAPQDWSFRKLIKENGTKHSSSSAGYLPCIAQKLGVREILAPSPVEFNGRICLSEELRTCILLRHGKHAINMWRGANAEGCELRQRQALAWSTAGCAIIVAWLPNPFPRLVAAHAGLKSVYGKERSVTESILQAFSEDRSVWADVHIHIAFTISANIFTHPWIHTRWSEHNRTMCKAIRKEYGSACTPGPEGEGRIDLALVVSEQFSQLGVKRENIIIASSLDSWKHSDGDDLWYTTRGRFPKRRNLSLVAWQ